MSCSAAISSSGSTELSVCGCSAQGVPVEDMTPRVIASERREWLEALAERSLSAIGDVELSAPAGGTARELREAAAWLETETERLRACAPVAVQRALRVFESTRGPSEPRRRSDRRCAWGLRPPETGADPGAAAAELEDGLSGRGPCPQSPGAGRSRSTRSFSRCGRRLIGCVLEDLSEAGGSNDDGALPVAGFSPLAGPIVRLYRALQSCGP